LCKDLAGKTFLYSFFSSFFVVVGTRGPSKEGKKKKRTAPISLLIVENRGEGRKTRGERKKERMILSLNRGLGKGAKGEKQRRKEKRMRVLFSFLCFCEKEKEKTNY